jgi:hypothetical protein
VKSYSYSYSYSSWSRYEWPRARPDVVTLIPESDRIAGSRDNRDSYQYEYEYEYEYEHEYEHE